MRRASVTYDGGDCVNGGKEVVKAFTSLEDAERRLDYFYSTLHRLDEWNRGRREAAARYAELGLGDLVDLPLDEPGHIYHLFVCRSRERDRIRDALVEAGVGTATYYVTPLHLQPALRFLGYQPGSLPETERVAEENFSVPLWPGMPVDAQERVVEVVRSAVGVAAQA